MNIYLLHNQNKPVMQPPINLHFNSQIPPDRILVNGDKSKDYASVRWSICGVNNLKNRFTTIHSIEHSHIQDYWGWTIKWTGHGLVPINIHLNDKEKTITIIL